MFFTEDLDEMINTDFVATCMIYMRTKFHIPNFNGSSIIGIIPKLKYIFYAASIFLSHTL
jgi:hypothetical protein